MFKLVLREGTKSMVGHIDHGRRCEAAPTLKVRLLSIVKFLLFAAVMAAVLLSINFLLTILPHTAPLMQQVQAGTMSASVLLLIDGTGFVAILLLSGFAAKIETLPFRTFGLPLRDAFRRRFWQGMLWGLILALLDIGLTYLLGGYSFGVVTLSVGQTASYGLAWALAFTLAGLFEEFLYRGYGLYALSVGIGFWPAAICISLLFAGLHLMNAGESIVGALDVMLYSLFACLTLRRTGNLWFAVGLHAAWDYSMTFLYSIPGSGMQATHQLLHSNLHGATWLTGGSAGPEGSVIGLVVLAASIALFAILFPNRNDFSVVASA
jgi:uncharacterized protein